MTKPFQRFNHGLYFILASLSFIFLLTLIIFSNNSLQSLSLNLFIAVIFLGLYINSLPRSYVWLKFYFVSIFIFLCLHPFLTHVNIIDSYYNLISAASLKVSVSESGTIISYRALTAFITGTYLGVLFLRISKNFKRDVTNTGSSTSIGLLSENKNYNIVIYAFYIFFILMLIDKLYMFYNASQVGYVQAFHIGVQRSFIFIFIDSLYPLVFVMTIKIVIFDKANIETRKFLLYSALFLTPYFFTFLSGFRGEFIAKFLVLMLIYILKVRSIPIFYFLILGVLSFIGIVSMEFIRFDTDLNIFDIPFELYLEGFLYAGNSFSVIGYAADYQSYLYHEFMYIFGPIIGLFSNADTYSIQGIQSKPYLAQHLMYVIDHEKFFRGSTIGSSSVAELYLIGRSFSWVFLGAFIFVLTANYFARNMLKSILLLFTSFTFFENFFLSPRGGFLKFIDKEFILAISICLIFIFIHKVLSRKKHLYINSS